MESSARVATNFFAGTPFSGQLNLLTTSSFDAVQDMFAPRAFAGRSVANFIVIVLMVVTFLVALFAPFPGRRRRKEHK